MSLQHAPHIVAPDGIHRMQCDGIQSTALQKPIQKSDPVPSVVGIVAEVVVAVDAFDRLRRFLFRNQALRLVDAAAPNKTRGRGAQIVISAPQGASPRP